MEGKFIFLRRHTVPLSFDVYILSQLINYFFNSLKLLEFKFETYFVPVLTAWEVKDNLHWYF